MLDGCMGDIFGSFRRDTGGAAETCEVQDTHSPVQPSCQEAKEGRGPTGPTRGTLLHTQRPHRRRGDTNGGCLLKV